MNSKNEKQFEVAIIGGGPAGLMAAIQASKKARVILIEKNEILGRKILATGNGRCNLTNRFVDVSRYHGGNSDFIKDILDQFDQFATMKFFTHLGIVLKEEDNGRIFPRTNQAQTIVDGLTDKVRNNKVRVDLSSEVKKISKTNECFIIHFTNGKVIKSNKLILATGGKASHYLGSSGDGLFWAKILGHTIIPTYPALVPIETQETWVKQIQGLKVEGKSTAVVDDKIVSQKKGDILFTHYGLSGPSIMAHVGVIAPYLLKNVQIHLDLFTDKTQSQLDQILVQIFNSSGKKTLKNSLSGLIPNNLASVILDILKIPQSKKTAEISKIDRIHIVKTLKNLILTIKQLRPFKEAQVTSGGIDLKQINPKTLQSKIIPGLYFCGEILDVDGDSGGFNLQWAWSSGYVAGQIL